MKFSEIRIFDAMNKKTELQKYFESDLSEKMFINDIVFLEEKKNRFDRDSILNELPDDSFLVLPLFNRERNKNTGVLIL